MAPITVIIVAPTVAKRVPVKHKIRPITAIMINIVCRILQLFIFRIYKNRKFINLFMNGKMLECDVCGHAFTSYRSNSIFYNKRQDYRVYL